jgi:hypothetical protein
MCATASTLSVFQRRRLDGESMSNDKKGARYAWFKANRSNVHDLKGEPDARENVKRRLQDCDAALASNNGPVFSTVAKLVDSLKRPIPEGTRNAELKQEAAASRA